MPHKDTGDTFRDCQQVTCQVPAAFTVLLCCTSAALQELRLQASSTLSGMTFWRSHDAWLSPMCTSNTTIRLPLLLSSTAAYTCKECPPSRAQEPYNEPQ